MEKGEKEQFDYGISPDGEGRKQFHPEEVNPYRVERATWSIYREGLAVVSLPVSRMKVAGAGPGRYRDPLHAWPRTIPLRCCPPFPFLCI